ncbi:DUF4595 domain-containing protein [Xylanibacter muris]|uniref:DUF4595 domain-containing protein n=1 Tax=Xylanibacter muris TaxID=2736290 RepID=A0ABX2AM30_9BACT|nr:DUF4595 domain-containing protein [Xylanibacter muris]NPD91102.1 DUF4595 domain-containing protein [Xylanibacter muris]
MRNADVAHEKRINEVWKRRAKYRNISYGLQTLKSDRAVMLYTADYEYFNLTTTYTFAFGENHFANRVIEADSDGDSGMIKYQYDKDGHVISIDSWGEDFLKMEWTNGNLTKIKQDEYDAYAVLTYSNQTVFERYNMSPFLLGVGLGPFMDKLEQWYERGLKYALYIGFLGKPCQNLPATIIIYDNVNPEPEDKTFNYYEYGGWGTITNSQ